MFAVPPVTARASPSVSSGSRESTSTPRRGAWFFFIVLMSVSLSDCVSFKGDYAAGPRLDECGSVARNTPGWLPGAHCLAAPAPWDDGGMSRPLITTVGCCSSTTARISITAKNGLTHARLAFRSGEGAFQERTLRLSRPEGSSFLHGWFELEGLAASSTVEYAVAVSASEEGLPSLQELSCAGGLSRFR